MTLRVTVQRHGDVICAMTRPGVLSIGTEQHNDLVLPPLSTSSKDGCPPDEDSSFRLIFFRRGPGLMLQGEGAAGHLSPDSASGSPLPRSGRVSVGTYSFDFEDLRPRAASVEIGSGTRLIRSDDRGLEVSSLEIEISKGHDAVTRVRLLDRMIVGSGSGCDLRLGDPFVSNRHLEILPAESGVTIRDLGSKNGTRIDGVLVTSAVASQGSRIEIGQTVLTLSTRTERRAIEPDDQTHLCGMAAVSEAMRKVFALLRRLAATDVPVLINGETGVGKELAARALHSLSPRSQGPFMAVNCAALSPQIFESELFGHVKGAFTGADRSRPGLMVAADGGTLFLDEIGDLTEAGQAKLLRVLDDCRVLPVGAEKAVPVDVRIVAATNRDLSLDLKSKRFRQDLYFRLSVFPVVIPPLRERPNDIPVIARALLEQLPAVKSIAEDAMSLLASMDWPGNVRQLRNVLSRAALLAEGEQIAEGDIMEACSLASCEVKKSSRRTLADIEREAILAAIAECGGSRALAAKALGIAKSTLYEKLKRYGIDAAEL